MALIERGRIVVGAELAALARESCPALAALRFIRVPAWRAVDDSTVMLGDVRYGGGSGSGPSGTSGVRATKIAATRKRAATGIGRPSSGGARWRS